ncbi:MAG: PilZ domain-containing protein [Lachnospiraceae bacterium]|nr:PilZ domain-containing protein [Lachnospiraceae bacterium]
MEKRTHPRIPVSMQLSISEFYKKDNPLSGVRNLNSPIQVIDISRAGLAFISECVLPIGYYFNANLGPDELLPHEVFTVIRIVHCRAVDAEHYLYGCEFTTQPEDLTELIDQLTKE